MAVYDLSGFNILLVEDNLYIRNILEGLLWHFRFGGVEVAANGEEAIEFLKTAKAGTNSVDIVLSDFLMVPINGHLLLRWVRGSDECPNRFIPFIMISGAAGKDKVAAARDLGVTEFLAKPFSVESIYRRVLEAIDRPRQFVATKSYFGPDRRRRTLAYGGADRRMTQEEDVTIVNGPGQASQPSKSSEVWLFRLPNHLKRKASKGSVGMGPGEVPTALLQQAEESLERAALDFADWAEAYLVNLSKLCAEAAETTGPRRRFFGEINLLAHELRGQGGTFGYPLITTFGKMLYDATYEGSPEDDNALEIVKAHIDAMRAVIREKVSGDGGQVGRDLLKSLKSAIDRYAVAG